MSSSFKTKTSMGSRTGSIHILHVSSRGKLWTINVPWPRMDPRGGFTINHYCLHTTAYACTYYFADAVIQGPRLQGWSHLVGFNTIRGVYYSHTVRPEDVFFQEAS